MKKIWILFPVLALLATGCSLPQKTVVDSTPDESESLSQQQISDLSNKIKELRKENDQLVKERLAGSSSTTSAVTESKNADWQTFSNKRYSYTIKYPKDWDVKNDHSESAFRARGEDKEMIGGDTVFSNQDHFSVNLMIYKVTTGSTYTQFISSKHFGYDKKEEIKVNGLKAVRLSGVTNDHPVGVTVVNTLVKVGDRMFVFNYSGDPISQSDQDIAEEIIDSLTTK